MLLYQFLIFHTYISTGAFLHILPFIIIILVIVYIAQPTQIHIKSNSVCISGFYGKKFDLHKIKNVQLSDSIPPIRLRTNGLGFGPIKKGYFQLENIGKCCLFLNGNYTPYLIFETIDDDIFIINNKDEEYIHYIYSIVNKNI